MVTTTKTIAATNGRAGSRTEDDARGPTPRAGIRNQDKIGDGRRDFANEREVLDEGESSEVDVQDEIESL